MFCSNYSNGNLIELRGNATDYVHSKNTLNLQNRVLCSNFSPLSTLYAVSHLLKSPLHVGTASLPDEQGDPETEICYRRVRGSSGPGPPLRFPLGNLEQHSLSPDRPHRQGGCVRGDRSATTTVTPERFATGERGISVPGLFRF